MSFDNEAIVRKAYQTAEDVDIPGFVELFTEDGTFTNESIPHTYRGHDEVGETVEVFAAAFPDMHRELYQVYVADNIVVVQLALQGTHNGPLVTPGGTVPPTGKRMDVPCCDVWEVVDGKIKRFDCYPAVTVMFQQLGLA